MSHSNSWQEAVVKEEHASARSTHFLDKIYITEMLGLSYCTYVICILLYTVIDLCGDSAVRCYALATTILYTPLHCYTVDVW